MKPSNNSVDAQHLPSGSGSSEKSTASPSSSSNGSPTDGGTDNDSSSFRDTQSLKGNDFTNNSSDSTQSKCLSSTSDIAGGECSSSSVTQGNKRKRKTSSRKSLLAKMLSFEDELSTDESCADEGEASTESITLKSPDNVTESSPLSKTGSEEFLASNADVEEGSYEELWEKCLISALSLFEDYGDIVSIGDSSETLDQSNVIISLGNSNRKTETGRELAKVTMQREDAFNSTLKMEGGREFAKDSIQIEDAFNLNLKAEEERGIGNESVQKKKEFL